MRKLLSIILILIGSVFTPAVLNAQAVSFHAEISSSRMRLGDRATLSIVAEGSNLNTNAVIQTPELGPFFRVEGQNGPSMSTEMSIINGRMSKRVSMQYEYDLVAAKAGKFTIPKIALAAGNQIYYSTPIQVEILEPQNAKETAPVNSSTDWVPSRDPTMQVELDKKEVYAGEQVVASWFLYYQRPPMGLRMAANPQLSDFKALDLEKATQLNVQEKYFKGMPWNYAFLQSQALYPLRSGTATVGSLVISYQVVSNERDFFGMVIGREEQAGSEPVALTVKPLPEPAPDDFTGAVGRFEVNTRIAKSSARVNENNQFVIEITGDGNSDYILEPKLAFPPEFEVYPPEIKLDTETRQGRLFAAKKFTYVLMAKKEGDLQIPPVGFRYFDPAAKEYKLAQSAPLSIHVEPGAGGTSSPGMAAPQTAAPVVSEDIRYIKPDRQSLEDERMGVFGKGWFWLAQFSGLVLVGLAFYFRAYRERIDSDQVFARKLRAFGQSKKRLKKARALARDGKTQDFIPELKRALLEYFGDRFSKSPWGLVEEEMQETMNREGVPPELTGEFMSLLSELTRTQFAGKTDGNGGARLLERSEKIIEAIERAKR